MINLRKLRLLVNLRDADDAYKAEVAAERMANEIERKLERGKFSVDGATVGLSTKIQYPVNRGRVIQLLAERGITVRYKQRSYYEINGEWYWEIDVPDDVAKTNV